MRKSYRSVIDPRAHRAYKKQYQYVAHFVHTRVSRTLLSQAAPLAHVYGRYRCITHPGCTVLSSATASVPPTHLKETQKHISITLPPIIGKPQNTRRPVSETAAVPRAYALLGIPRKYTEKKDACYDGGAPLFFLILPLNLGAKDLPQKPIRRKNQAATG